MVFSGRKKRKKVQGQSLTSSLVTCQWYRNQWYTEVVECAWKKMEDVDENDDSEGVSPFTIIANVLFYILLFFQIIFLFLYRLAIATAVFLVNAVTSVFSNPVIAGILAAIFLVGIPLQIFPEEIYTVVDDVHECGVRPVAEATASIVLVPFIRVPYEFLAEGYNTPVLFIFDGIGSVFGSIQTLQRAGRVTTTWRGVGAVGEAVLGGDLDDLFSILQDIATALGDYFAGWGEWFVSGWNYIADFINTWFVTVSMFSGSCTLCAADPSPRSCPLRTPLLPGQAEFDCNDCHELSADFGGLVGGLLDAVTGSFLQLLNTGTSFERIGRAFMCPIRSFLLWPVHTIVALIDGCRTILEVIDVTDPFSEISQWWLGGDPLLYNNCDPGQDSASCCGRPAGCTFPKDGGDDLPTGIIPCLGELVRALTGDAIDDFIELILEFIFPIVSDVTRTVVRITECAADPEYLACLERYPITSGTPGVDPGVCFFNGIADALPDGGVYQCFTIQHDCLAANVSQNAPLLEPLVGDGTVLKFLLGDFWRYSIDAAVCAIATAPNCFGETPLLPGSPTDPVDTLPKFNQSMHCLCENNPVLGFILGCPLRDAITWVEVNVIGPIQDVITEIEEITITAIEGAIEGFTRVQAVFDCVGRCNIGEILNGEIIECFDPGPGQGGSFPPGRGCEGNDQLMQGDLSTFDQYLAEQDALPPREPTVAEMNRWRSILWNKYAVPTNGFCGRLLYGTHPSQAIQGNPGIYAAWVGCYGMYGIRMTTAERCEFMPAGNLSDARTFEVMQENPLVGAWKIAASENCTRPPGTHSAMLGRLAGYRYGANYTSSDPMGLNPNFMVPNVVSAINASSWQLMPNFVYPLMDNIRSLPVYHRTEEFYQEYKAVLSVRDDAFLRDPEADTSALDAQLDQLYVEWANDILARHRTGGWHNETTLTTPTDAEAPVIHYAEPQYDKATGQLLAAPMNARMSPSMVRYANLRRLAPQYLGRDGKVYRDVTVESLREGPNRLWARLEELRLVEAATNRRAAGLWGMDYSETSLGNTNATVRAHALGGKRGAFAMSDKGREVWDAINDATQLGWWGPVARVAGVVRALRARDGAKLGKLLGGKLQYRMDTDEFVRPTDFAKAQPAAAKPLGAELGHDQPAPNLAMVGVKAMADYAGVPLPIKVWQANHRRVYAPFPIPKVPSNLQKPSWIPGAAEDLQKMHEKYQARRQGMWDAGATFSMARRHTMDAAFDLNAMIIGFIDSFFQIFTGGTGPGPFATLANDTVAFWSEFDLRNFTAENVTATLESFASCSIPENIDGTSLHSPFCFLLLYVDAFALFTPVDGSENSFPLQIPFPKELITKDCVTIFNGVPSLANFDITNNCRLPTPPDIDTRVCNRSGVSCTGDVTLRMNPQVNPSQRFIGYTVEQSGVTASCPVTQATFSFPNGCANIVNVTSEDGCVTGYTTTPGSPSPDQECSPPLQSIGIQGVIVVDMANATIGSTCSFVVEYSIGVVPTAGPASFFLTGEDQSACAECELRFPTVTCQSFDAPLNDLYRDCRPLCDDCVDPFCPGCDVCRREYQSCAAAGFGDVLDSFLYLTGSLGFALDEITFGGVDAKLFELWYSAPVTLVLLFILSPLLLSCIGIPIVVVALNVAALLPWVFFIFFGGIVPWPVVLGGLGIYVQFRKAPWYELLIWLPILLPLPLTLPGIPILIWILLILIVSVNQSERAVEFLRPFFIALGVIVVIWLLSLIFTFPSFSDVLQLNAGLRSLFIFFDSSNFLIYAFVAAALIAFVALVVAAIFFATDNVPLGAISALGAVIFGGIAYLFWTGAFLINFSAVVARIDEFQYAAADDIPGFHTFCFWTSLWNISLLGFIGLLFIPLGRFAYRGLFASILFVGGVVLWLFSLAFAARRIEIYARTGTNKKNIDKNTDRLRRAVRELRDATKRQATVAASRLMSALRGRSADETEAHAQAAGVAFDQQLALRYAQQRRARASRSAQPHDSGSESASAGAGVVVDPKLRRRA